MKFLGFVWLILLLLATFSVKAEESATAKAVSAEVPFSTKVKDFWNWWQENLERIEASADADGGKAVQAELASQVEKLGPDFSWSLGPPPKNQEGHSFTLSPSGDRALFFLTSFWLEQAPELAAWHFYSAQPANLKLSEVEVMLDEKTVFKADNILLTLTPAAKAQLFDLEIWSPLFQGLTSQDSRYLSFLFLTETLGENGLARWIENVNFVEEKPDGAFVLLELPQRISDAAQGQGWVDSPYESTQYVYTIKEPGTDFLRHDIEQISTLYKEFSLGYLESKGKVTNPMPDTGARFVFFRIPRDQLPEHGNEMESFRYIQGVLDLHLKEALAGKAIGGGIGAEWVYFDLIFFDEATGVKVVQDVTSRFEGDRPVLHSFY